MGKKGRSITYWVDEDTWATGTRWAAIARDGDIWIDLITTYT